MKGKVVAVSKHYGVEAYSGYEDAAPCKQDFDIVLEAGYELQLV